MTQRITSDFEMQRPLLEGDQAIVDAIEQISQGERGDMASDYIVREPARRISGNFGEVAVGRVVNETGQQEVAFIDVQTRGILAGIDTRELGANKAGEKSVALPIGPAVNSPEAQAIKIEAARRITAANAAIEK